MGILHVKAATHNTSPTTVGTKDDDTDPYGIQGALDNLVAGDEIRIWADAVYNVATQLDVDGTSGTVLANIVINGANASGVVDGTRPVLQATASISFIMRLYASADYYRVAWLEFDGNSNAGYGCGVSDVTQVGVHYYELIAHDCNTDGFYNISNGYVSFTGCDSYDNGGRGFNGNITGVAGYHYCRAYGNTSDGFRNGGLGRTIGCLSYGNGGVGFNLATHGDGDGFFANNVAYGNTGNGATFSQGPDAVSTQTIVNNTFVGNGGDGLNLSASYTYDGSALVDFNHYHGNTGVHCNKVTDANINDGTVGVNNVEGDPQFIDPTGTPPNFTPKRGSILIGRGLTA